ncbi:MAG: transglutaminase-like domain-containing protein [Gemmatimonadota bacterium]|nr:transglutaminase-like domain-containing protein [Gemmatimonadota bacterium]
MNRRGVAVSVVLLWLAGLGLLGRRELMRGEPERLAQAALLVSPSAEFYAVTQRGRQIGFASSTIDTTTNGVSIYDLFVADIAADSAFHRTSARLLSKMSRSLRLQSFVFQYGPQSSGINATGMVNSDSSLTLVITPGGSRPDTQHIALNGPLLLPNAVPLALALAHSPKVGKRYTFNVFDPLSMKPGPITLRVLAESLLIASDSAVMDTIRNRWVVAHLDTVKAWHIEPDSGSSSAGMLSGWVDERGRMVRATEFGGFVLDRRAFEIAYKNWTLDRADGTHASSAEDIQETTAIEASAPIKDKRSVTLLRLRLRGVDLASFPALSGGRQATMGDTLAIHRETEDAMVARYQLPADGRFAQWTQPEPLIQSDDRTIREVSKRIQTARDIGRTTRRVDRDPRVVAERLNQWVFANLEKKVSLSVPSAIDVLHRHRGDCNEHTALYIALARAAGLPARGAAGLVYVDGKFYYHAWPEVYLGTWVPVDPTFGQFPADASHVRFVSGGYVKQAELLKLVGNLQIDVLASETQTP